MKFVSKSLSFVSLLLVASLVTSCYPAHTGNGDSLGGSTGSTSGTSSTFTIGGTLSGLSGTGLILQDNGGNNLTLSANGAFTFSTGIASGDTYAVTVFTQPSSPTQTCSVTGGTGTVSAKVTSVAVTCVTGTTGTGNIIGGQVTGLLGSGLILQDNGGDSLPVKANGTFNFATTVNNGSPYAVTVLAQPSTPTQTCTVGNGSGTATGNVGNIVVTCSSGTLSLGGSVTGLAGSGLTLGNGAGDSVAIAADGTFTFPVLLVSGSTYDVTITAQPTAPAQTCTITNNTGTATANVINVQVTCPAVFYTVGGQVVGMYVPSGQQSYLVLQNNGGDNLPLTGDGAFTFVTPIASGSAYDVSIFVQPTTQPDIGCIIWGWKGMALSDVTNVTVDCGHDDWTWMDGPNTSNQDEVVTNPAEPHTARDADTPGGSKYSSSWTDKNNNLWLFTGESHVIGSPDNSVFYGEMWEFVGTNDYFCGYECDWVQITGPFIAPPPGRWGAVTWTDPTSGNLYMFGGQGGGDVFLNDLWSFTPGANTWTEVFAPPTQNGVYGTKGVASGSNYPGARWGATGRVDSSGNVWLFGGFGFDGSSSTPGLLNDLWKYSGGQWTWVSGSNVANQNGVYGTEGTASASNVPGGRQAPISWLDNSGNFWIFGGYDLSATGQPNAFNDLWEYSGGQWTWVSGANTVNQTATYGSQGVAASTNVPGARWAPAGWSDSDGNFWLYGGFGYDNTADGSLADLWEYTGGQWIWMKGPNSVSQTGVYGLQASTNVWPHVTSYPGSRWGATYWVSSIPDGPSLTQKALWMFGGEGFDSASGGGDQLLGDLWRYLPYP